MITTILWDVDGTLLDFKVAQAAALRMAFEKFGLGECDDEMIERYSRINDSYWEKLELNLITKKEVLVGRFVELFEKEGFDVSLAEEFDRYYMSHLGDTIAYRDDSINIVKDLKGKVKQYIVSNGTVAVQNKKLSLSGLGELMDGIFLSEAIGHEKPNMGFFDAVLERIEEKDKNKIMIVGDSLTSDIKGGNNAGIVTCLYDPSGKKKTDGYTVDRRIEDLHGIYDTLDK